MDWHSMAWHQRGAYIHNREGLQAHTEDTYGKEQAARLGWEEWEWEWEGRKGRGKREGGAT